MSDGKGGIPFSGNGEYYILNYSMCKKPWDTVRVALGSKVAGKGRMVALLTFDFFACTVGIL